MRVFLLSIFLSGPYCPGWAEAQSTQRTQNQPTASAADESGESADVLLRRGLALARADRLDDAEQIFLEGKQRFPADQRFLQELAGLESAQSTQRTQNQPTVSAADESGESADVLLRRGLALARADRLDDAKQIFLEGRQRFPSDQRFLQELAGLESAQSTQHTQNQPTVTADDESVQTADVH
jgi:hypothetical protein